MSGKHGHKPFEGHMHDYLAHIKAVEEDLEYYRAKRFEPLANPQRIVLLTYTRSVQDGQMKWWLHERVNFGYTEAGLKTLQSDVARVRAAQAEKAAREARK